tara:strand:+ start:2048 stop:2416 length:369 start_codon:yes stop_codon:yes gene_type:complete
MKKLEVRNLKRSIKFMKYIFIVFISFQLHSQFASDSLKGKSINYLFEKYSAVSELDKKHAYSEAIIYNSKSIEDITSLVAGYHFKATLFNNDLFLKYLDSILHENEVYLNKGIIRKYYIVCP